MLSVKTASPPSSVHYCNYTHPAGSYTHTYIYIYILGSGSLQRRLGIRRARAARLSLTWRLASLLLVFWRIYIDLLIRFGRVVSVPTRTGGQVTRVAPSRASKSGLDLAIDSY